MTFVRIGLGRIARLSCLLIMLGWAAGCGPSPTEKIQEELTQQVDRVDGPYGEVIDALYSSREHRPIWTAVDGLTDLGHDLVRITCQCREHGLSPDVYGFTALEQRIRETYVEDQISDSLHYEKLATLDLELSRLFFEYADDLLNGQTKQKAIVDTWHLDRRTYPLLPMGKQLLKEEDMDVLRQFVTANERYEQMKEALGTYREIHDAGGWPTINDGPALNTDSRGPRVLQLEERLRMTGDLPEDGSVDSTYDRQTVEAVERFQKRHGLERTGIVREEDLRVLNIPAQTRIEQLAINLERERWLPAHWPQNRLTVNITDYQLDVFEEDKRIMEMPVIVGAQLNETPVFADTLSYVVFRPYWYVPTDIAAEEILPHLREDMEYLEEQQYEIVTGDRKPVPEDSLEEVDVEGLAEKLENRTWIIRREPGANNPLGRIKFMFPNAHSIYLHDTPEGQLFSRAQRTFSHGCVRIEQPVELADYVLGREWSKSQIRQAFEEDKEPESVQVARSLPVYILYFTAWVGEQARVNFRNDIYNHDPALREALGADEFGREEPCASLHRVLSEL